MLAQRALALENADEQARIAYVFERLTSRQPSAKEMQVLQTQLAEARTNFSSDPEAAAAFLGIGEAPNPSELPAHELAAYTLVANTILNLDESINRG